LIVRVLGFATVLLMAAGCGPVDPPPGLPRAVMSMPTAVPSPRTDANSQAAHMELLEKARSGVIDAYFVGDSITRRWGALDYPDLLEHWNRTFFGWNAANFAWGGDRTENILWRLENGELDGVEPRVFVVQAGTNNLGDFASDSGHVDAIVAGIRAILETCLDHAPDAVVLLTGVFPRSDRPEFNPAIRGINVELEALADAERVRYVDITEELSGDDGRLLETMSNDGLHLSEAGYQVWADRLVPMLTEILGPPAAEDFAPPATGNPAAGAGPE
jgi:lysophospholipase L1-like esterase